jgi:hypothetical protein
MPKVIHFSDAASIGIHSAILIAKTDKPVNAIRLSEKFPGGLRYINKTYLNIPTSRLMSSPNENYPPKYRPSARKSVNLR